MSVTGEILWTPGAGKALAAFVRDGERVLFVWPVDSWGEGEAKIQDSMLALEGLAATVAPIR